MTLDRARSAAVAAAVILVVWLLAIGSARGAMERGPKPRTAAEAESAGPYEQGAAAARAGDCKAALPLLDKALAASPKDPDVLNVLAYCQRKTGRLDDAFANYRRALELRPQFPLAREYLGEAHIQGALREIEVLRGYGDGGRKELDQLVAALREAAETAARGGAAAAAPPRKDGW